MKNILLKTTTLSILTSSLLLASGWRLPESSSKSVALSGAYIANANGADSSYYNPANISFNKNTNQFEIGLMLAKLESIKYTDNVDATRNGNSTEENTLIPSIFISSKDFKNNNIRYGFSVTVPGGLTKRWSDAYPKAYAQKFSLKIIDINPSIAYKVSEQLSIAGGLRAIYSEGIVQSDGTDANKPAIRDMEGSTTEYGYNLALTYKPEAKSNISVTYRSNVDLKEEGNAKLYLSGTKVYDGGASVTVPLPAVLAIATSYKINDKTTVEFEYDKTYWSSYKNLDFEYKSSIPLALKSSFDDPKPRNWKDTDAYRLGVTHKYNKQLTLMLGYSKDGQPIPDSSVSFESPDYNSHTLSTGFDYELNKTSSFGFGYLYSKKDNRNVSNTNEDGTPYVNGKLTNAKAHLISLAYRSSF